MLPLAIKTNCVPDLLPCSERAQWRLRAALTPLDRRLKEAGPRAATELLTWAAVRSDLDLMEKSSSASSQSVSPACSLNELKGLKQLIAKSTQYVPSLPRRGAWDANLRGPERR